MVITVHLVARWWWEQILKKARIALKVWVPDLANKKIGYRRLGY